MTTPSTLRADLPSWGAELVQILRARRGVVLATAIALSLLGVLVTLIAPGLLPPEPLVGAAVGVAAWLLATAAAVAVDAGDSYVRGPRHVRATGAVLAGWVPPPGGPQALGSLVRDLNRAYAAHGGQRVWFVPTTDAAVDVVITADALATGLCQVGRRILLVDLVSTAEEAGISDVVRGAHSLGEVVRFDPELLLARVGTGAEPETALQHVSAVIDRAPGDVDVLIVVLPAVDRPGVLAAVAGAKETYLLARAGTTGRVELLAGLEALESSGTEVSVVLLDDAAPAAPLPVPRSSAAGPDAVTTHDAEEGEFDHVPSSEEPVEIAAAPVTGEPDVVVPDVPAAPAGPTAGEDAAEPLPASPPAGPPRSTGADALLELDAAPAPADRFRTAVALEALAQDHWRPDADHHHDGT